MSLRRILLGLVAVAFVVAIGYVWYRIRADRLVADWLAQDCSVGESGRLEARLARGGGAVERALSVALERGVPPDKKQVIARAAGRQYDQAISAFDAGRRYGLSANAEQAIRNLTRDGFVKRAVDAGDRRYRSAARRGLDIIRRTHEGLRAAATP